MLGTVLEGRYCYDLNGQTVIFDASAAIFAADAVLTVPEPETFAGGGSGTAGDPYKIGSADEMRKFAAIVSGDGYIQDLGACAELTASINLGGIDNPWTPIGQSGQSYAGTFDGAGFTLSGLYIDGAAHARAGIFGDVNNATIKKLTVSGTVRNTAANGYAAGIAAYAQGNTKIQFCANNAAVSALNYAGGVAGYLGGGVKILDCENNGSVTTARYGGGLCAYANGNTSIERCVNTQAINKNASGSVFNIGGICGVSSGSDNIIFDCLNTAAQPDGYGITTNLLSSGDNYVVHCLSVPATAAFGDLAYGNDVYGCYFGGSTGNGNLFTYHDKVTSAGSAKMAYLLNDTTGMPAAVTSHYGQDGNNSRVWAWGDGDAYPVFARSAKKPAYKVTVEYINETSDIFYTDSAGKIAGILTNLQYTLSDTHQGDPVDVNNPAITGDTTLYQIDNRPSLAAPTNPRWVVATDSSNVMTVTFKFTDAVNGANATKYQVCIYQSVAEGTDVEIAAMSPISVDGQTEYAREVSNYIRNSGKGGGEFYFTVTAVSDGITYGNSPASKSANTEKLYVVTFDKQVSEGISCQLVLPGGKAPVPATPGIPAGYISFIGWYYMDGTTEREWDFVNNTVTRDVTIYAKYATLQTLVDDNYGGTLTLDRNYPNINYMLEINGTITIDLNGHTISFPRNKQILVGSGGNLTVMDGKVGGGGVITKASSDDYSVIMLENGGNLNVTGGTIGRETEAAIAIFNDSAGEVHISGGSVLSPITAIHNRSRGTVRVSGSANVVSARMNAIYSSSGSVVVSGGTVETKAGDDTYSAIDSQGGTVTVSGGTIRSAGVRAISATVVPVSGAPAAAVALSGGPAITGIVKTNAPIDAIGFRGNPNEPLLVYRSDFDGNTDYDTIFGARVVTDCNDTEKWALANTNTNWALASVGDNIELVPDYGYAAVLASGEVYYSNSLESLLGDVSAGVFRSNVTIYAGKDETLSLSNEYTINYTVTLKSATSAPHHLTFGLENPLITQIGHSPSRFALENIIVDYIEAIDSGTQISVGAGARVTGGITTQAAVIDAGYDGTDAIRITLAEPTDSAIAVTGGAANETKWSLTNSGYTLKVSGDDLVAKKLPKLAAPANPTWSGSTVSWDAVTDANGYRVGLLMDGATESTIIDSDTASCDVSEHITASGSYTVAVIALGDGVNHSDSELSAISAAQTFHSVAFDPMDGTPEPETQYVADGAYAADPSSGMTKPSAPTQKLLNWYRQVGADPDDYEKVVWNFATDKVTADISIFAEWVDALQYDIETNTTGALTLGHNYTLTSNIYIDKAITIDLHGHTVDCGSDYAIYVGANSAAAYLTLEDGATGGTIKGTKQDGVICQSAGTLKIKGGTLSAISCTSNGNLEITGEPTIEGTVIAEKAINGAGYTGGKITVSRSLTDGSIVVSGTKDRDKWDVADTDYVLVPDNDSNALIARDAYTVTFNSNGGSAVAPITRVAADSRITAPTAPTKTEYDFVGWFKEDGLVNEWNFSTDIVSGSITLYAKWKEKTYTVTFDSNGGSAVSPITGVTKGSKITAPTDPTKTEYDFVGWYKEAAFTHKWDFETDTVAGDATLYAKWRSILAAPTNPEWSATSAGSATWSAVDHASGYSVQLYKGGIAQGTPVSASGAEYDFTEAISELGGSYTFTVIAKGDGTNYGDSPASAKSQPYIYQQRLTVTGTTAADKDYDGNTTAVVTLGTVSGIVSGHNVTVTASGTFADKDIDEDKTVTVVYALEGDDAGKYAAPVNDTPTADINAKQLTVTGSSASDKAYDGKKDAVVTLGTVSGIVSGEDVTVTPSGAFETADVGKGKDVSVSYSLSGANIGNYLPPADETLTASILYPAPTNLSWNGSVALWDAVEGASQYEVYLYKGGTADTNKIADVTANETNVNLYSNIIASGAGTYYFKVRAKGDGEHYADGAWSLASAEYVYGGSDNWTINIRMASEETFPLSPTAGDSIEYIKSQIQDKKGYVPNRQRLRYLGTALDEGQTLVDYKICDGATLDLTLVSDVEIRLTVDAEAYTGLTVALGEYPLTETAGTGVYKADGIPAGTYALTIGGAATGVSVVTGEERKVDKTLDFFTVSFEANGGTPEPAAQVVLKDGYASAPDAMTKGTETFGGWYSDSTFSAAWDFAANKVTAKTTLYAKWVSASAPVFDYTVTVHLTKDGAPYAGQSVSIRAGSGASYALTEGANGAYTNSAVPNGTYTVYRAGVSTGVTVTVNNAHAGANVEFFTVSFNANGGTPAPTAQIVLKDGFAAAPPAMTRGTDTFGGWYSDAALSAPWNFAVNKVVSATTLNAKWVGAPPTEPEITSIEMPDAREMVVGESDYMSCELEPAGTLLKHLTWTSDNPAVATVDANGMVTALAPGKAVITGQSKAVSDSCAVTVVKRETDTRTPMRALTVGKGKKVDLNALAGGAYLWESSDTGIATVSKKGVLTGKKIGQTTVTGTLGGAVGKSSIVGDVVELTVNIVKKSEAVTKVALAPKQLALAVGETGALTATITPKNAVDKNLTWTTADAQIAAVDANGTVTGIASGITKITATATSGVSQSVTVTVTGSGKVPTATATEIALSPDVRTQKVGEKLALNLTVTPANADTTGLTFTSSHPAVATVDAGGWVTGVSQGETLITARLGTLESTCRITIEKGGEAEQILTLYVDFLAIAKNKTVELADLTGFAGSWDTADEAIASVTNGILKAKKPGETTLTFRVAKVETKGARFMEKSLKAGDSVSIRLIVVKKGRAVTKIKLSGATILAPKEKLALAVKLSPAKALYKDVFWQSANPSIATVDEAGVVTGVSKGKVRIIATATSGISKAITVTVRDAADPATGAKAKRVITVK